MKNLSVFVLFSVVAFTAAVKNTPGSVGQSQYGSSSYGGSYSSQDTVAASAQYDQQDYGSTSSGYASPSPSKYPPAMTHEYNRQQSGYDSPKYAKKYQEKWEGLFDDFPGPKTKQRIYYPGRGYVYMEVPIQQKDKYSKDSAYSSGAYSGPSSSSYDDDQPSYNAPPPAPYKPSYQPQKPSYPPAMPSYSAPPAPSYSASAAPYSSNSGNEDDDSPFGYLVKKGAGTSGYQGTSYSAGPSPAPKPPTPYVPPSSSYDMPKYPAPTGADYSPSGSNQGSSHGSYSSFNPSGYTPGGAYPSTYPDAKSASTNVMTQEPADGPRAPPRESVAMSVFSSRTYSPSDMRGFYDLAEQPDPRPVPNMQGQQPGPGSLGAY